MLNLINKFTLNHEFNEYYASSSLYSFNIIIYAHALEKLIIFDALKCYIIS